MNQNLYISDLHFGHINVTKAGRNFDNRPFNTLEEMHEMIKVKWNAVVHPSDHVYILGDLIWLLSKENADEWCKYLDGLNGNLHWILGNHDDHTLIDKPKDKLTVEWKLRIRKRFDEIVDYKEIIDTLDGQIRRVILSHYYMPFYNQHYHGAIMLHGHSHISGESFAERAITKRLQQDGFKCEIYNVGCMYPYIDYAPRSLQYIVDNYGRTNFENLRKEC